MGRRGPAPAVLTASIQGQAESLALFHHNRIAVTLLSAGSGNGLFLGGSVGKQQEIRNVFIPRGALLWQVIVPSQQFQDRPDQFLLRDRFIRVLRKGQSVVTLTDIVTECVELRCRRYARRPLRCGLDPVGEEVVGKEISSHVSTYTTVLERSRRPKAESLIIFSCFVYLVQSPRFQRCPTRAGA